MKNLIGYVRDVSGHEYYLETHTGEMFRLKFIGKNLPPINTHIALTVPDEPDPDDGSYHVVTEGKYYSLITTFMLGASESNRKHIALFRKMRVDASDATVVKELQKTDEWAVELENFWKRYGRHMWDVKVKTYPLKADCSTVSPEFCKTAIQKYIRENDMEGFEPVYHHVWDNYSNQQYCGLAFIYGFWGATYEGCSVKTCIHEIGHNFGLHHSNLIDEEYGDKSSVMGKGQWISGLILPNLISLQLLEEKTIIDKSRQILLAPIEMSPHSLHENEHRNVILRTPGNKDYYLSIRKDKGWPYIFGSGKGHYLFVHTKNDDLKTVLEETMRPGDTKRLLNGVTIQYHEYINETARVSVLFNPTDPVEDQVIDTEFPEHMKSVVLGNQHNGLWYDPDFDGQGFDVQIRDNRMSVIWYTYNEDETSRRYYIGSCDVGDGIEEFDMYTTEKGTFADPTTAQLIPAGKGQLYFFDDVSGVFNYNTPEFGRGSIEIQELARSQNPMNGLWYVPERNNEGFSIQFFDHLNTCTVYWYTYGKNPHSVSSINYKKNVTQRWFLCQGVKTGESYTMKIYETRGGKWLDFTKPDIVQVGEAVLSISDASNINFDYTINADSSVSGTGSFDLTRLL